MPVPLGPAPGPCRGPPGAAPFIRQVCAALGLGAFVLAATADGFRVGLLLMIAVGAAAFVCILALAAHSLHTAHPVHGLE